MRPSQPGANQGVTSAMTPASRWIVALLFCADLVVLLPASAADKTKPSAENQPKPCAVYGPGFEPVGDSGVCVRIGVSVEMGVKASFHRGKSSVATSADWIDVKAG